ncbi:MAG: GNAT family N-acetyltransferase [Nocardioidaceae bacterium]
MRSGETLYYLEIGSRTDGPPDHRLPTDLVLVEQDSIDIVRALTLTIGRPYDWPSQHWDDDRWAEYMRRRGLRHWTAERGGEAIGLASLRFDHNEVELDTFGLVPRHVGKGLDRTFLTIVVDLAWREAPDAERIWLHTSVQTTRTRCATISGAGFGCTTRPSWPTSSRLTWALVVMNSSPRPRCRCSPVRRTVRGA